MKRKYTYEEKIKHVKYYLKNYSYNIDDSLLPSQKDTLRKQIRMWVYNYQRYGVKALKDNDKIKKWSNKIKLDVCKRLDNGESNSSVAVSLGMTDTKLIREWYKKYRNLGSNSIKLYKRGIYTMKRQKPKSDEKLAQENKQLRKQLEFVLAENEYLKKVKALVQRKMDHQTKKNQK